MVHKLKVVSVTQAILVSWFCSNADQHAASAGAGEVPSEKGAGTNGYIYFVCNSLGGPLSKLPAIKPTQIKAARLIKKYLTGKLDAAVSLCSAAAAGLASRRHQQLCQDQQLFIQPNHTSTLSGQGGQQLCRGIMGTASPGSCQGQGLFCWLAPTGGCTVAGGACAALRSA